MNQRFFSKKRTKLVCVWFLGLLVVSMIGSLFFYENLQGMDFLRVLEAPSWAHPFGTDALGRDVLGRVILGARVSLFVALVSVGISVFLGILVGAVAGFYGGWCDKILMAVVNIMLCFPIFFLLLAIIAFLGPSILNIMIVIGVTSWMGTARLVRAEILKLKEREFVLAAHAMGAPDHYVIVKHLVPNALSPVIVNAILAVSTAILLESGLSFLGIGVQPPTPSWGNILMDGKSVLGVAWWVTFFPGMMIFLTVLSANILGEELRDSL